MEYEDIIIPFANKHHFDIVHFCAKQNGYAYFHLDFTGRPRYTGLPHIIKVNATKKILIVTNLDEIYWAFNQLHSLDNSSK